MTPDRTWDPIRFRRGTRGFAALVTAINGPSCWASACSPPRRLGCRIPSSPGWSV